MATAQTLPRAFDPSRPLDLASQAFAREKYALYPRILEEAPVCQGRIALFKVHLVSRYEDCVALTGDDRFVRNRSIATGGGSRLPFPMPRSVSLLLNSMIQEDGEKHRRLRGLVNKAFTPRAVERFGPRIEALTQELLDGMQRRGSVDLLEAYAMPIPVAVISEMVGVKADEMPEFQDSMRVMSKGLSGWNIARTFLFDLRRSIRFVAALVERKRAEPQDDILSALIEAEDDGDRLSRDEIIAMVFLLIIAGYETTTHLISNGVLTLLEHPDQLERLRSEPELLDSAVEEILRHRGPVHGTKLNYAREDVTFHGVTIAKGRPVIPLLAAANHDPSVFEKPEVFDVARTPNRHLAFSFGKHFCLGAQLARMETRIALRSLIDRCPNLRLAVAPEALKLQRMPLWHRYERMPVRVD